MRSGPTPEDEQLELDEDAIVGRYVYLTGIPTWGRCKVFYEQSGEGEQDVLFLHTAGSDSRQYHGVLNDTRMREKCRMTAFDLPAHGRSFPYEGYHPGTLPPLKIPLAQPTYRSHIQANTPTTKMPTSAASPHSSKSSISTNP